MYASSLEKKVIPALFFLSVLQTSIIIIKRFLQTSLLGAFNKGDPDVTAEGYLIEFTRTKKGGDVSKTTGKGGVSRGGKVSAAKPASNISVASHHSGLPSPSKSDVTSKSITSGRLKRGASKSWKRPSRLLELSPSTVLSSSPDSGRRAGSVVVSLAPYTNMPSRTTSQVSLSIPSKKRKKKFHPIGRSPGELKK